MKMYLEELVDAFHLRLGRLTHASAQLDFIVGLALNWIGPYNNVDVSTYLNPKIPLAKRLTKLEELTKVTYDHSQPKVAADFERWFRKADSIRALRNDYVHARWGLNGIKDGEEPYVIFLALTWNMDPDQPDNSVRMTLKEFDQQIDEVNTVAYEFNKLCKRHEKHVAYAAWYIAEMKSKNIDIKFSS